MKSIICIQSNGSFSDINKTKDLKREGEKRMRTLTNDINRRSHNYLSPITALRPAETKGRVNDAIFTFLFFLSLSRSPHSTGQLKEWQKKYIPYATEKSSTSVVTSWRQFNLCACTYKRIETRLLVSLSRFVYAQVQTRRKKKKRKSISPSINQTKQLL